MDEGIHTSVTARGVSEAWVDGWCGRAGDELDTPPDRLILLRSNCSRLVSCLDLKSCCGVYKNRVVTWIRK